MPSSESYLCARFSIFTTACACVNIITLRRKQGYFGTSQIMKDSRLQANSTLSFILRQVNTAATKNPRNVEGKVHSGVLKDATTKPADTRILVCLFAILSSDQD